VTLYCASLREASGVHRRGVVGVFLGGRKQFSTEFQDSALEGGLCRNRTRVAVP
jgi:hypothetical protein